jgi:alanyl-tRNA synthetase
MAMTSDQIRSTYLEYFESQGHLRERGASLIPPANDKSALFVVAGMHPLKAYFAGTERPPAKRLTTCQPSFRTGDIENVGVTARHLTMFEMLGNFSFGDYFKRDAIRYAWELSRQGFGLNEDDIWVTVFGGDDKLGLGPDQEAIDLWLEVGMPRERIIELPREENFWESGATGPCGPDSELYLDRGLAFGTEDDLPGGENARFLEFWNLVFMQFNQEPPNVVAPLPAQNIDTGMGLNRMAAILQGKETVFETDQFAPLIDLGQELSGAKYENGDPAVDRALRLLADHTRAMTFLIADGVVPSNEDRGYVLRRIMRRAILQGRETLSLDPGFLTRYQDVVTELMGGHYNQLLEQHDTVSKWLASEEENFGRTLEQGSKLLDDLIARARDQGAEGIAAADAFLLHDTHGFPIDLTLEIVAEHGLGVDQEGFEGLMSEQRRKAREHAKFAGVGEARQQAQEFASGAGFTTEFQGYGTTALETTVGAVTETEGGNVLIKLLESPFYATGGGQIADSGQVTCADDDCAVTVTDVLRIGDDQVLSVTLEHGDMLKPGERVRAVVDRPTRHATEANHTVTHLLHAALRARLGAHVHQAGSYVGPDKLRFDFNHPSAMSPEDLRWVEDQVNTWILGAYPVRALTTTLDEARSLGAMALFGEKYGDIVRMVEVGDGSFSRELCGGTHVHNSAEIGVFRILSETSSAANVRRIEAVTGPAAVELLRAHDRFAVEAARELRIQPEGLADEARALRTKVKTLEKAAAKAAQNGGGAEVDLDALLAGAETVGSGHVLVTSVAGIDGAALAGLAEQLKSKLGDAAVVLAQAGDGKVDLVAAVAPALIERGIKAGAIVKLAAAEVGGGGGGRDNAARAGGRDVAKLEMALSAARAAIGSYLS